MIKELVRDTEILSTPCRAATAEDAALAQDLVDTLTSLEDAGCLAANQIGETVSIIAYLDDKDQPHTMFNPKMLQALHGFKTLEGCLSHDEEAKVTRYDRVKIVYQELIDEKLVDRKKDFTGWTAQMLQHMIDHCKGKLV